MLCDEGISDSVRVLQCVARIQKGRLAIQRFVRLRDDGSLLAIPHLRVARDQSSEHFRRGRADRAAFAVGTDWKSHGDIRLGRSAVSGAGIFDRLRARHVGGGCGFEDDGQLKFRAPFIGNNSRMSEYEFTTS